MSYKRVLPRDLFNEAKLLKCIGRLFLMHHDGELSDAVKLIHDTSECEGFDVRFDENNNRLYVNNVFVYINDEFWCHGCSYNSRDNYSLVLEHDEQGAFFIFNEEGRLMPNFLMSENYKEKRLGI